MMKGRNTGFSLVYLVWLISGSYSVTYLHDPSSLNLSCNPYGRDIKLTCTVQEPATLVSPLSFLILWYWSGNSDNYQSAFNGCQLYPSYQCTKFVGHSKYMFEFKRYRDDMTSEGGDPVMYRTLELTIRNVSVSDKGCYYCRPWINLVPLNETSGSFCIDSQFNYEGMTSCPIKHDIITSSVISSAMPVISSHLVTNSNELIPQSIATQFNYEGMTSCPIKHDIITSSAISSAMPVISSHPVTNSNELIPQSIATLATTSSPFILQPTIRSETSDFLSHSSNKNLELWLYVCIALCIVLGITTILLAIITIILGNNNRNNTKDATGNNIATHQQTTGYENRIITPSAAFHQPDIIGIYSYVGPTSNTQSPPDTLPNQYTNDTLTSTIQEKEHIQTRSQIYETLDKHIEELECHSTPQDLCDGLFDDPNYSPICTSHTSSLIIDSPPDMKYDKLALKSKETSEYAYAYINIPGRQRKGQPFQQEYGSDDVEQSVPNIGNEHELLRIAALGKYEMDPRLISTLKKIPHDVTQAPISPPKIIQKSLHVGTHRPPNCYQSLDQKTLAPDNSYMCTTVNK